MGPESVEDRRAVVQIAASVVESQRSAENLCCLGAALYRSGDYAKASELLNEAIKADFNGRAESNSARPSRSYAGFFLAMAYHQTGDTASSSHWLSKAGEASTEELRDRSIPWHQKLTLELLRNEASELIGTD